jgi:hypothetical protein
MSRKGRFPFRLEAGLRNSLSRITIACRRIGSHSQDTLANPISADFIDNYSYSLCPFIWLKPGTSRAPFHKPRCVENRALQKLFILYDSMVEESGGLLH